MRIEVNGVNINYQEYGSGNDYCLFLHGNRDNKDVFYELSKEIQGQRHLLLMDYRGHGKSDISIDGYNYQQFIYDINMFLEKKKVYKVNIIGHSLGGVLAVLFYLHYPEKVNSIVLMGTSSYFSEQFARPEIGEVITKEKIKQTNELAKPYFFGAGNENIAKRILANWSNTIPFVHQKMIEMGHVDLRPVLEQVKCKVLIIVGSNDAVCSVDEGKYINSMIQNSRLEIIENSYHYMFMEELLYVSKLITSFLDSGLEV